MRDRRAARSAEETRQVERKEDIRTAAEREIQRQKEATLNRQLEQKKIDATQAAKKATLEYQHAVNAGMAANRQELLKLKKDAANRDLMALETETRDAILSAPVSGKGDKNTLSAPAADAQADIENARTDSNRVYFINNRGIFGAAQRDSFTIPPGMKLRGKPIRVPGDIINYAKETGQDFDAVMSDLANQ